MQDSRDSVQIVDITPHPRILRMLGEIAFEPHKCIGELIDNSIDGFLNQRPALMGDEPEIMIQVPHRHHIESGRSSIVVEDNGPGMTLNRMVDAARAGYSHSSPVENLGLFGMGFNIATARLGRSTELRSGVKGEERWWVIEIDLNALQRRQNFSITPRFEHSAQLNMRITIRDLRVEQAMQIAAGNPGRTLRSVSGLRSWIGRTYARYLRDPIPGYDDRRLRIIVNGEPAAPYRWCVWGQNRYVEVGPAKRTGEPEKIYAYQKFDELLGEGQYCTVCLAWAAIDRPETDVCVFCGHDALIRRDRRMQGWIGVQRHLNEFEFGLDFLRNGRAILQWDKRVFSWRDPDSGRFELEYPIDQPRASDGRIVGEVEIDHVPVHYQKDSFEEDHKLWHEVIEKLRGVSPLRPQVAKRKLYAPNQSLLSKIYRGFNRTRTEEGGRTRDSERGRRDKWAHDLIINQETADSYYEQFRRDDPEYQSDQKWYEWMVNADREMEQESQSSNEDDDGSQRPSYNPPPDLRPRSEQDQLRETAELDEALSGTHGFQPTRAVEVSVYRTSDPMWVEVHNVRTMVPIKAFQSLDGTMECFYDPKHPRLVDDSDEIAELIVSEASLALQRRFYERFPYSYVLDHIRRPRLDPTSPANVENQARTMISQLVPRLVQAYAQGPFETEGNFRDLLSDDEMAILSRMVGESGGDQTHFKTLLDTGEFLIIMPTIIGRVVRTHPHVFLDGVLFSLPYSTLPQNLQASFRQELGMANAERVANLIDDIAGALRSQSFESSRLQILSRKRVANSLDLIREITVAK